LVLLHASHVKTALCSCRSAFCATASRAQRHLHTMRYALLPTIHCTCASVSASFI
jgi:hypothetical protein